MNLPLFLARKIYGADQDRQKVSRPAIRISILGVAIGLAVMIVSVSVVLGFKHTIRDKVAGFGSHITVGSFMTLQAGEQLPIQVNDSLMKALASTPGVKHVQRFAVAQGILKTDADFLGVMFKGIGPEYDTTFIHQNLVEGVIPAFSDTVSRQQILISKIIADQLQLHVGDRIFAYFIQDQIRLRRYTVSGIYQTNLTAFDQNTCFTDLYSAIRLNGWEPDQMNGVEVAVNDFNRVDEVEDLYIDNVNRKVDAYGETYSSQTIQDSNPQIFSWLELLDLNVWIILALMICVAAFTMISGLLIIILERTSMIGTLKALGAKNRTVRKTFLWFAVFIIGRGLLIGNILGIGLILLQHYTGLVKLDPTTYYVSTVPVELNIPLFLILNLATLALSILVLIGPSYLISRIHPAKSMRYE